MAALDNMTNGNFTSSTAAGYQNLLDLPATIQNKTIQARAGAALTLGASSPVKV